MAPTPVLLPGKSHGRRSLVGCSPRGRKESDTTQRPHFQFQGIFHAKMGTIKDRNVRDVSEAEDIKKKWQEYTELYKKDLHDADNHDGVITHLERDILECEVKRALESITMNKASGGDGISVEVFQILKDDAMKVLHLICQQINSAVATGLEKVSFHSNLKERQCQRMLKLPHNCTHLTC